MFAPRFAFQSPALTGNARRVGNASTNASLTWTAAASATTSTTQAKFGTASQRLPNLDSRIASATSTIAGFGTTDFTIECFIYIDTLANYPATTISNDVFAHDVAFGFGFRLAQQNNGNALGSGVNAKYLNVFARQQADLDYWTLPSTWPVAQWNFVVIQRQAGVMAAWVNGTLLPKSNASSNYAFATTTAEMSVGTGSLPAMLDPISGLGNDLGTGTYAYIDEFCISNTYRYNNPNADIPVPTAPFTVDSYTTQLLHMDGSNGGTTFTNATS